MSIKADLCRSIFHKTFEELFRTLKETLDFEKKKVLID